MTDFFNNLTAGIAVTDVLDILIVTYVIYKILAFIRETRAQQLVKGLLILVAAYFLSDLLHLYTLHWILKATVTLGAFALIVIFQPELRRGLEYVGRSKLVKVGQLDKDHAKRIVDEFVRAIGEFSRTRTGALIIIERETALNDIAESGTLIDADITAQLLGNIFYEGAPLHDGAVIVRRGRVYAAGCVLPLTENKELNKSLGTRHRAGIGITENSDALVFIVSEETGIISMAEDGKLTRFLDTKAVEKVLLNIFVPKADEESHKFWPFKFSVDKKDQDEDGGDGNAEK
jgi:TIGR00159 family protein